jgi:hypothetical protein
MIAAWIIYGIYCYIYRRREKKRPRTTEHLKKVRGSFDEYAKKLEEHSKKKPFERKEEKQQNQ